MSSQAQQDRSEQSAEQRRRKRKERAAKSRTPEPKNIVSGAGQPLDPGVRRELEEQLGHDLSRVRLHTGRDAGQLTELLGADAVAVGQDILFREGAFRPGTDEGRRLLAHELLHTVQNPHGLGALRAGRELGAVSLPQQAIEREAESAARDLVRPTSERSAPQQSAPEVEEGRGTPGWLRYTTVDADRMRAEAVDPATLVDRLANGVLRSLRGDPADASGRVRLQLGRMSDELAEDVVDRLERRLLTSEYERLLDLYERSGTTGPLELQPADVPLPEVDLFEELGVERVRWKKQQESGRGSRDRRAADAREERQDARARDEKSGSERSRAQADAASEDQEAAQRTEQEDERNASRQRADQEQRQEDEKAAADRERTDEAADERAQGRQQGAAEARQERKEQREREEADPEQAGAPGADKRKRRDDQTRPAAGSRQTELDPKQKAQPGPVRPEKVDERAEQPDSALSEHGLNEKDQDGDAEVDPREEEQPLGLEAGADREVAGGQDESGAAADAEAEPAIKPEDHLPEADLDLSAVPTADAMRPGEADPSPPSFPTPPPTKAEKIEQEREKTDQQRDEDSAGPEPKAPGQDEGPVEGEASQPENGPAAQAQDRGTKDLQETEKPLDQEVGPDPATEDRERPEPEAEKPDAEQQQDHDQAKDADDSGAAEEGGADERPDAKDAQDEKSERQERARDRARSAPGPVAAGAGPSPATAATSTVTAAAVSRPAGAQTPRTPVEDRDPSPAARRGAEPPRPEREAPTAKSRIPKESGPGAAPRGPVGGAERSGPTTAAGPGAAPSVAQAAVSPAAEQTGAPGQSTESAAPQPEASLEKDGGGCAPPEPAAEKDDGGKGGCGGGGEAAPEEKEQEPPDVSGQDPKTAVQTVSKLAPDQAVVAMSGVDRAADKKVGEEQQRLAASPPTRERPSGAPQTRSAPPEAAPAAAPVTGKVERLGPADQGEKQQAKGSEKAAGRKPTDDVPPPPPPAVPDKGLSDAEAASVEAAADAVPTTDPQLANKTVGPAPKIRLEGASDPTRTDDQAKALKEKQSAIQRTGRDDAAKPLGEDQIFPDAPREQLTGKASGGAGKRGKGGALKAASRPKDGVGAVAKQEKGSEIQGAGGQAQGDLGTKEQEHKQGEQRAKQEKQAEIDREVDQNTEKQTAERGRVARETQKQREEWRTEQDKKTEDADKKTEEEHTAKNKEIVKARDDKDKEVAERKDKDNAQIDTERENAEKEAEKKKEEEKPSGGFFGWVADKVGDFFKGLLEAVTKVFEAARALVNGIIDKFKEWANAAIDFVRDLAVSAINALADALIAIGDVLLAAFPELRDRFRNAIEGMRDAAIATVNQMADGLKKAVNSLLDALAAGLNTLLDVLEAGIKAVIKGFQAVIEGAIKFAQAAIEALGKFAALVADIAPDPGGWISKAGSSAKTGITDHLWGAIKVGVKRWFDTKVEGILGLGKAVINVLVKGCVSLKQIGRMAWDAIIASLPMMIASLVIEKVVSMIVPAAGAILTIVQGLMAAWQSISSILAAFSKFWAYLKAVKAGPAACLFAEAVAAGIVALLDFIANFLMIRLSSATKGVGKRLQAMSQKILDGLKKTGKGARSAAGAAVNKARGALRNAKQRVAEPAVAPKPKETPSPTPKSPVKPKDTPTPKGPAKPDPKATKPKDAPTERPDRDRTPEQDPAKKRTPDQDEGPVKDRVPDKDQAPAKAQAQTPPKGRTSDTGPKKKKEIEGPKPTKPKKPRSPAGKALAKAKGAVKSAVRKVTNAARTLGRKLKKSKVGRALKSSAAKIRDFFKKKKDRLRDDKRRQHEQKRQHQNRRRKDEKSQDSKHERLNRIIPRVRRNLVARLARGIPERVLGATLDGLRRHYRLTSLTASGDPVVDFDAKLNPGRDLGADGFRVQPAEKEAQPADMERPEATDQALEESEGQSQGGEQQPKEATKPTGTSKRGAVVYDKNRTEKEEEEDKNPPPYSRMRVYAKRPTGGWQIGQVESVAKETFHFYGHGKDGPAEFDVRIKNKAAWSKIPNPGNFKYGRSFEQIRNADPWSQYDPDARQSLNYRNSYQFKNQGGRKWNWHHIHEQVASGPNSVDNLARSRDYANQEFNVWMARKQPARLAPDGTFLPGTGSKSVRKYLAETGASAATHRRWGLTCIRDLGYRIEQIDKGRGLYQQIRK
ncbi:eCIS core domain-containing protein [Streptomyces lincolnensis]|uniref:eCIS core domain-containing protein n=1 Tax=Streptomyces lincolnensis TaxID=1915 RepID=UPI0037D6D7A7